MNTTHTQWKPPPPPVQLAGVADLSVMTPLRPGLVEGAWDTVTYGERFDQVLRLLDTLRKASRESALNESPYFDLVGRWQIVHFFRFARVPAGKAGVVAPQILLNVTFDGLWEPYMRVIWGPLGPLLDLIFCHSTDYRLAHNVGFDDYMRWVRDNEVRPGFFYADGVAGAGDLTATVGNASWLAQAERTFSSTPDPEQVNLQLAMKALVAPPAKQRWIDHVPPLPEAPLPPGLLRAISAGLRVLRGFFLLRIRFEGDATGRSVLLRAAQALLEELHDFIHAGGFTTHPMLRAIASTQGELLAWFGQPRQWPQRISRVPALPGPDPTRLQHGVLESHAGGHGLMMLVRVRPARPDDTLSPLARIKVGLRGYTPQLAAATAALPAVTWNLGFTPQGLVALGLDAKALDSRFPLDFRQGMESRATSFGDLGPNHPQQWRRPLRNWRAASPGQPAGVDDHATQRIALEEVHAVVQLRTSLGDGEAPPAPGSALPRLVGLAARLEAQGLEILSVQPLARQTAEVDGKQQSVGHFGFVDPKSQPDPGKPATGQYWSDDVPWGEVLLGHPNPHRDDEAWPAQADALLDNGSFWVVRKLRQFPGRLESAVPNAADRERLMGRRRDGGALLPTGTGGDNDYRFEPVPSDGYAGDPNGQLCPFQSHVRRANPRTDPLPGTALEKGQTKLPRLLRRGISYGPDWKSAPGDDTDRGLMFTAFNARIADQFEAIQRWLSGGNSSGVPSDRDDPICGVSRLGAERHFVSVAPDGRSVQRIALGAQPFVQVQWGLYLFSPSLDGLRALADLPDPQPQVPEAGGVGLPAPTEPLSVWKLRLETGSAADRHAVWQQVRAAGGVVDAGDYGVLVGSRDAAMTVLRDPGDRFSVRGYGQRMEAGIGLGYLGQDGEAHDLLATTLNEALRRIPAAAGYGLAHKAATGFLSALPRDPDCGLFAVDLVALCDFVIAKACRHWFGLPDGKAMLEFPAFDPARARCPASQVQIARHVFLPHPQGPVEPLGIHAGKQVHAAGAAHVDELRNGQVEPAPIAKAVLDAVDAALPGQPQAECDRVATSTLVGLLQGLPATVFGHLSKVLMAWLDDGRLWERQRELATVPDRQNANAVMEWLMPHLQAQMALDPVPDLIWRTSGVDATLGKLKIAQGRKVVVSLRSVAADTSDPAARHAALFGSAPVGSPATFHGCPGDAMAHGLMLGVLVALFEAGSMQRSGSPTALWLRR